MMRKLARWLATMLLRYVARENVYYAAAYQNDQPSAYSGEVDEDGPILMETYLRFADLETTAGRVRRHAGNRSGMLGVGAIALVWIPPEIVVPQTPPEPKDATE